MRSSVNAYGAGWLSADAEVKQAGSHRLAQFDLAVISKGRGSDGKVQYDYLACKAWDAAADAAEMLAKGDFVSFRGVLKQERWTTKKGDKRSKIVIHIMDIGRIDTNLSEKKSGEPEKQDDEDFPF